MQIEPGFTILLPKPNHNVPHLWVVLTEASRPTGEVVIVNLTSKKAFSDTTVVLDRGDHPFISHPTVVNYSDARLTTVDKLEQAVGIGFDRKADVDDDILDMIQKGIYSSDRTPNKIKEYCQGHF